MPRRRQRIAPSASARDDLARVWPGDSGRARSPGAPAVPFGGVARRQSSTFFMMVALRRDGLPAGLEAWWATGQQAGSVRVRHRLELQLPEGDAGAGWRMQGRLRCLTPLHWIPVVVELWPRYDEFTMMTMTPQRPVLATRRYFRVGHAGSSTGSGLSWRPRPANLDKRDRATATAGTRARRPGSGAISPGRVVVAFSFVEVVLAGTRERGEPLASQPARLRSGDSGLQLAEERSGRVQVEARRRPGPPGRCRSW